MPLDETQIAPKRRGPKPKTQTPISDAQAIANKLALAELEKHEELQRRLEKAKRIFEDMWPFLDVELHVENGNITATAKFDAISSQTSGVDAKQINRDLKKWARFQLWQEDRQDIMTAWAKSDPAREEWIELNVPLETYKNSSGTHAR